MLRIALTLGLLAAPALAAAEKVTIRTEDGMVLRGDLYASGHEGAPGVVALHMYRMDRSNWTPVAERFQTAGIDFLAIDMRGHGKSAVQKDRDLTRAVMRRDPKLFDVMYRDAVAAGRFLVKRGTDSRRIALLGADIGAGVALGAAAVERGFCGAALMTPVSISNLDRFGDRPLLVICSEEELFRGAEAIHEATGCELWTYDKKAVHGTYMFGRVEGLEDRLVGWFRDLLGAPVALDGLFLERQVDAEPFTILDWVKVWVTRRGRYLHVVFEPPPGKEPPETFRLIYGAKTPKWAHARKRDQVLEVLARTPKWFEKIKVSHGDVESEWLRFPPK